MSYKCKIVADSAMPQGHRLTTYLITYPRIIHAEMCRHRILSRNTASSRAIPFKKMVEMVENDPFIPIAWQKDHKGMQGTEYVEEPYEIENRRHAWIASSYEAIKHSQWLNNLNVTKQLCNRLLEPFMWTTELVSGTEWNNFFELRCPQYNFPDINQENIFKSRKEVIQHFKDTMYFEKYWKEEALEIEWLQRSKSQAEIHIQKIAEMMYDAMNESKPNELKAGEWHIPNLGHELGIHKLKSLLRSGKYDDNDEITPDINEVKLKISTSHCARISYTTLGDSPKIDYEADINLHDRLLLDKHMSPFEHCARAMNDEEYQSFFKGKLEILNDDRDFEDNIEIMEPYHSEKGWCNNFKGFIQYRYLI